MVAAEASTERSTVRPPALARRLKLARRSERAVALQSTTPPAPQGVGFETTAPSVHSPASDATGWPHLAAALAVLVVTVASHRFQQTGVLAIVAAFRFQQQSGDSDGAFGDRTVQHDVSRHSFFISHTSTHYCSHNTAVRPADRVATRDSRSLPYTPHESRARAGCVRAHFSTLGHRRNRRADAHAARLSGPCCSLSDSS